MLRQALQDAGHRQASIVRCAAHPGAEASKLSGLRKRALDLRFTKLEGSNVTAARSTSGFALPVMPHRILRNQQKAPFSSTTGHWNQRIPHAGH
jgi:hypothetical protein